MQRSNPEVTTRVFNKFVIYGTPREVDLPVAQVSEFVNEINIQNGVNCTVPESREMCFTTNLRLCYTQKFHPLFFNHREKTN
jgi:hypothetical protein